MEKIKQQLYLDVFFFFFFLKRLHFSLVEMCS